MREAMNIIFNEYLEEIVKVYVDHTKLHLFEGRAKR